MTKTFSKMKEFITEKIARGEIVKHSKIYYVILNLALYFAAFLALALAVFFGSFVVFTLRFRHPWLLMGFGWPGFWRLLLSLPWLIAGFVLVLVAAIEFVSWRYTHLYRKPLLYSVLTIILVVVVVSSLIARTTFHSTMFRYAQHNRLPFAGFMYRMFNAPHLPDGYFGQVVSEDSSVWQLKTNEGDNVQVVLSDDTRFPTGKDDIHVLDNVLVFGPRTSSTIYARGIRKITRDTVPRWNDDNQLAPPSHR